MFGLIMRRWKLRNLIKLLKPVELTMCVRFPFSTFRMNLFDQGYVELNGTCHSISLAVGYPMTNWPALSIRLQYFAFQV
jgi:hypothetical protein